MLKKKIVAILAFALLSCGSVVLGGQNSNSSTTMQPNNMGNMSMSGSGAHRRRRGRRHQRRHRRRGTANKNANN